jgi:hypothetical protein
MGAGTGAEAGGIGDGGSTDNAAVMDVFMRRARARLTSRSWARRRV